MVIASRDETMTIEGPAGPLEVAVHQPRGRGLLSDSGGCAVVCHPHPQHGGTMDNKVVTTLVRAYGELGLPAVRFNFRGVGASAGHYDDGRGEVDDLVAVANWFRGYCGAGRLLLAGFSFGSSVAGNGVFRLDGVDHLTLVAPPVGRYGFAEGNRFPCPACVVMGERDELVEPDEVYRWTDGLQSPVRLLRLPEASHFFHGQLVGMRRQLVALIGEQLR